MQDVIKTFIIGQEFDSYSKLCKVLEIPSTGGNTKKSNLKKIGLCCNYSIKGQKITINEVYEVAIPKAVRENNRWVDDAICEVVLEELQKLVQADRQVTDIFITNYSISILIGLCNKNFYFDRNNYTYADKYRKEQASTDFYKVTSEKIPSIVSSILNSLKKRYLIHWVDTYSITRNETEDKDTLELATDIEIALIKDAQVKVALLEPFNKVGDLYNILKSPYKSRFNKEVNKILKEPIQGFRINTKGYRFFVTEHIQLRLDKINRIEGVRRINTEMRAYLQDKLESYLSKGLFLGALLPDHSVISGKEQKEIYELTFKSHIDYEITIED